MKTMTALVAVIGLFVSIVFAADDELERIGGYGHRPDEFANRSDELQGKKARIRFEYRSKIKKIASGYECVLFSEHSSQGFRVAFGPKALAWFERVYESPQPSWRNPNVSENWSFYGLVKDDYIIPLQL